ncbi:MAG: response regulator [Alistipes sp.]|jgi:two-component SAPR family response regulator|nr:response regulator [Alistipes sp.]
MANVNYMIVEDEYFASERLVRMVSRIRPSYSAVARTEGVRESVEFLRGNAVDLIFMDVKLADGDCFDIFDQIRVDAPVIFITAFGEPGRDARGIDAIESLSKPLEEEELHRAVEKFERLSRERKAG